MVTDFGDTRLKALTAANNHLVEDNTLLMNALDEMMVERDEARTRADQLAQTNDEMSQIVTTFIDTWLKL